MKELSMSLDHRFSDPPINKHASIIFCYSLSINTDVHPNTRFASVLGSALIVNQSELELRHSVVVKRN